MLPIFQQYILHFSAPVRNKKDWPKKSSPHGSDIVNLKRVRGMTPIFGQPPNFMILRIQAV